VKPAGEAMFGIRQAATKTLLASIKTYRLVVSPWLPARCRFEPSCSAYAAEAIALHGPLVGARLAVARIARCHPWHAGGHDPVPAAVHVTVDAPISD
jgi:putative membrane protein insertion efficiency factor